MYEDADSTYTSIYSITYSKWGTVKVGARCFMLKYVLLYASGPRSHAGTSLFSFRVSQQRCMRITCVPYLAREVSPPLDHPQKALYHELFGWCNAHVPRRFPCILRRIGQLNGKWQNLGMPLAEVQALIGYCSVRIKTHQSIIDSSKVHVRSTHRLASMAEWRTNLKRPKCWWLRNFYAIGRHLGNDFRFLCFYCGRLKYYPARRTRKINASSSTEQQLPISA